MVFTIPQVHVVVMITHGQRNIGRPVFLKRATSLSGIPFLGFPFVDYILEAEFRKDVRNAPSATCRQHRPLRTCHDRTSRRLRVGIADPSVPICRIWRCGTIRALRIGTMTPRWVRTCPVLLSLVVPMHCPLAGCRQIGELF